MQNGIAHNGLILLWRMREGKHLCPGKTTLSDHAVLYLPVSTFVGNRAEMSPEAAGIAACLMAYSHHACRTENYAMTVHYYRLRDYALQHPECSAIMRIID